MIRPLLRSVSERSYTSRCPQGERQLQEPSLAGAGASFRPPATGPQESQAAVSLAFCGSQGIPDPPLLLAVASVQVVPTGHLSSWVLHFPQAMQWGRGVWARKIILELPCLSENTVIRACPHLSLTVPEILLPLNSLISACPGLRVRHPGTGAPPRPHCLLSNRLSSICGASLFIFCTHMAAGERRFC